MRRVHVRAGVSSTRSVPAFTLAVAVASSLCAAQLTHHVSPCGDDGWTGTSPVCLAPDGPKRTIQAAIDASISGDLILVADGAYTGEGNRDMSFGGRAITVRGIGGASACLIDVQGSVADPHRAFRFSTSETNASVLEGFTIRGGSMEFGGAVLCEAGSSPTITRCVFEENFAYAGVATGGEGGALRSAASSPLIVGCVFRRNTAQRIGTIGGRGGGAQFVLSGAPVIRGCTFEGNVAGFVGGGIHVAATSPTITDCTFVRNETITPAAGGGAGYFANPAGHSSVTNCRFIENRTSGILGGAWINNGAAATFTSCEFIRNHGFDAGGLGFGNNGSRGSVYNCLFDGNTSDIFSGALEVWNAAGVASSAVMSNCTFVNNVATSGYGAIVVGNTSNLVAANCVVWDNSPAEIVLLNTATTSFTSSNIQGGWPGAGNIDDDPVFSNPGAGRYSLASYSPCIDAGDNTALPPEIGADLAALPRFRDDPWTTNTGIPDPTRPALAIVDMGAYEFQDNSCAADFNNDGRVNARDFFVFLAALLTGSPSADFNSDGVVNAHDLFDFLHAFFAGCD